MVSKVTRVVESPYIRLLLSEKLSDVHFHCPDGTVLHAHKVILSTESTYFSTVFEGPWDRQHPEGKWVTTNPPDIMKVVLTYIYTGMLSCNEQSEDLLAILSLAHEYELKALTEAIAEKLNNFINFKNIKDITQKAYIFGLVSLKESCCLFIHENCLNVLMDENFIKLSVENKNIWLDLKMDLESTSSKLLQTKKKRKMEISPLRS